VASSPTSATDRPSVVRRGLATRRTAATFLTRAAVVHIVVRVAVLAAVLVAVAVHPLGTGSYGGDIGAALGKSDGVWYLGIAHHGYGSPPPIGPDGSYVHLTSLAFFPLYPLIVRVVAVTGLPYLGAALLVTGGAGLAAALLVALWARAIVGTRGALVLLAIWELFPSSAVLDLAYSEALFVAAAAGALLALQRRAWVLAGLAATVAGLTRPTGGAVVAAVWVAVGLEWWRRRRPSAPSLAAALVAPVGLLVSLGHVAIATGRLDGWFWLERTAWQSGFDAGWTSVTHVGEVLTGGRALHRLPEIVAAIVVVAVVVGAVLAIRTVPRRGGPARVSAADAAYAVVVAVLGIGERSYFYVKPRLLFVGFPLLTPVARRVAAMRARPAVVAVGLLVAVASVCYQAYLLVGWPKAL
jgi:hypothetical protein